MIKQQFGPDHIPMPGDRFDAAANDLRQLSGVIECVSWSDSVSVRYSGPLQELKYRARDHDLYPVNMDGVLYAEPFSETAGDDEDRSDFELAPASEVRGAPSVQSAHLVETGDNPRLRVTTTGVEDAIGFLEVNGPYGWIITEAKEAQIRLAPPTEGVSFLLSRSTSEGRGLMD
jgi:hypothetical protein